MEYCNSFFGLLRQDVSAAYPQAMTSECLLHSITWYVLCITEHIHSTLRDSNSKGHGSHAGILYQAKTKRMIS